MIHHHAALLLYPPIYPAISFKLRSPAPQTAPQLVSIPDVTGSTGHEDNEHRGISAADA